MSNEPKHTATPWRVYEDTTVIDKQGSIIVDCHMFFNAKADAARIVQCVNEYDGLIETIESLRAVNAELIEALRVGRNELERAKMSLIQSDYSEQSSTIQSINNALTTLAKYEKP